MLPRAVMGSGCSAHNSVYEIASCHVLSALLLCRKSSCKQWGSPTWLVCLIVLFKRCLPSCLHACVIICLDYGLVTHTFECRTSFSTCSTLAEHASVLPGMLGFSTEAGLAGVRPLPGWSLAAVQQPQVPNLAMHQLPVLPSAAASSDNPLDDLLSNKKVGGLWTYDAVVGSQV